MKKTLFAIAVSGVVATVAIVSCQKNYSNYNAANTTVTSLNELFSELRTPPQRFLVQAGTETTVIGEKGTQMHFYANSFKDEAGNIITSGAVDVELTEMYTPGDMIANRAPTTTPDGDLLQSGGEINLKATMNGKEVYSNGYGVKFKQPEASAVPMYLFYGNTNNEDSTPVWTMADTSRNSSRLSSAQHRQGQSSNGTNCDNEGCLYVFDTCTKFNNINCDRFSGVNTAKTTISVTLPDNSFVAGRYPFLNQKQVNTEVYLIFPKINGCMMLGKPVIYRKTNTNTNDTLKSDKVPIGWDYKIAVVAHKDGKYYYWQTAGVSSDKMVVTTAPVEVTADDIRKALKGL